MKINLLYKIFYNPLFILLLLLNIGLAFFLFKPESNANSTKNLSSKVGDYPEILALKDNQWDFQKSAKFFKDLSTKKGGEYGYHALTVALSNGLIAPNIDAHLLGHTVGDVLYKQKGIQGIKVCTDDIRNACSHSIVVGYLLDYGEENLPVAVETCEEAPGGKGAYTMCIHGLGHGVLAFHNYDMRKASDMCSKIGTVEHNNQEVGQCIGGVTMEMMAGVHDKEVWEKQAPNFIKKEDPLSPCNMGFIPKDALGYCYTYLTPQLFKAAGASLANPEPQFFNKAMSYCKAIPGGDRNRQTCFGSFGKEFVVLANARNVQSVTEMSDEKLKLVYDWCNAGPKEALAPCLGSAQESLYWGGENEPDVSIRFCGVLGSETEINRCMRNLISMVKGYIGENESYNKSFCGKIPSLFQKECQSKLLNDEK